MTTLQRFIENERLEAELARERRAMSDTRYAELLAKLGGTKKEN